MEGRPDEEKNGGLQLTPALQAIVRGETQGLASYLDTVGPPMTLGGTKSDCRTHWVTLDGNGRPRVQALATRLAEEVMHYCIPRSRIDDAVHYLKQTGSTNRLLRLQNEALKLFTKLEKSGEGGELLLYALMELQLGIPQILCKMSLKTNTEMHVHGVDGVHATMLEDDRLAVYWGESKIYDTFTSAIGACFDSIEPYLNDEGGGPLDRDLHLVRDNIDVGKRDLTLALARYFDNDNREASQLEVRAACLIGFSHDDYQSPYQDDGVTVRTEVVELMADWQAKIAARIVGKKIHSFGMEIFCVPMPSAKEFRQYMRSALGLK